MIGLYLLWMLCVASVIIVPLTLPAYIEPKKSINRVEQPDLDVLITCHPKDSKQLKPCIDGVLKHISSVQKVHLIMLEKPEFLSDYPEGVVIWHHEGEMNYPFSVEYYRQQLTEKYKHRSGWYYQQMIKLYCDTIPDIREYVLILDADTVIVRPFKLFDKDGKALFGYVDYFNEEYRKTGRKLNPRFRFPLWDKYSMIDHHMIFHLPLLQDLKDRIRLVHKKPLWEALGDLLPKVTHESAFSEYELYANFVHQYYPDHMVLRPLEHINTGKLQEVNDAIERQHCDMISLHDYLRLAEEYDRVNELSACS